MKTVNELGDTTTETQVIKTSIAPCDIVSNLVSSLRGSAATVACLSYATCSTALTLANKRIFSEHAFNFPWTLLCIQSFLVMAFLIVFQVLQRRRALSFTLLQQMLLPCCLFTMYIFTNSRALRHVSLPIFSVLKSLAPMGIALTERAVFGEPLSMGTVSAMALIVLGNIVTVFNDLEFSRQGYTWALCNVALNIIHVVSLRFCLSDTFTPLEKTIHSNFIATLIMFCLSVMSGELPDFLKNVANVSPMFKAVYLLSCMLSAGIGFSVFWVIQKSSGSTLSFVGACNKFVVVILGGILFHAKISPVGWVSVFFGVLAGVIFAVSKAHDKKTAVGDGAKLEESDSDGDSNSFDLDEEGKDETVKLTGMRPTG